MKFSMNCPKKATLDELLNNLWHPVGPDKLARLPCTSEQSNRDWVTQFTRETCKSLERDSLNLRAADRFWNFQYLTSFDRFRYLSIASKPVLFQYLQLCSKSSTAFEILDYVRYSRLHSFDGIRASDLALMLRMSQESPNLQVTRYLKQDTPEIWRKSTRRIMFKETVLALFREINCNCIVVGN